MVAARHGALEMHWMLTTRRRVRLIPLLRSLLRHRVRSGATRHEPARAVLRIWHMWLCLVWHGREARHWTTVSTSGWVGHHHVSAHLLRREAMARIARARLWDHLSWLIWHHSSWWHGLAVAHRRARSVARNALALKWLHRNLSIERSHRLHTRRILNAMLLLEMCRHVRARVSGHVSRLRTVVGLALVGHRHHLDGHTMWRQLLRHLSRQRSLHR